MQYEIEEANNEVTVSLNGKLTFQDHRSWREMMEKLMLTNGKTQVVDLNNLDSIDSAGLGMLLLLHEKSEAKGKGMVLKVSSNSQVSSVLKLAQIEKMIPYRSV